MTSVFERRLASAMAIKPWRWNGTDTEEVWGGRCVGVKFQVGSNPTGGAITLSIRDTTGGNPTGGRLVDQVTVGAGAGTQPVLDLEGYQFQYGCVVHCSAAGANYSIWIQGADPEGDIWGTDDGADILQGNLLPSSNDRADTVTLSSAAADVRTGSQSVRMTSANPNGTVRLIWNSLTQNGVTAITPAMLMRNIVLDIKVENPGQKWKNGALGTNDGPIEFNLWIGDDSSMTNSFRSENVNLAPGWNRVVLPREGFTQATSGVGGPPNWSSTTYNVFQLEFKVGTSTNPNLVVCVDRMAINCSNDAPTPLMIGADDGWDPKLGLTAWMRRYPALKLNAYLVRDFTALANYGTWREWNTLMRRTLAGRLSLMWHSVDHSGPTAMETLTQQQFTDQQITPWIANWAALGLTAPTELHGVTPNGQISNEMRAAFIAAGFKSNRTIMLGANHPWNLAEQPMDRRIYDGSGSLSYPARWTTLRRRMGQHNSMEDVLLHSISYEDGSTTMSGSTTSLNQVPTEVDDLGQLIQGLSDAGLIRCVLVTELPVLTSSGARS